MRTVAALTGVLLIVWTLREVFRDLFHPSASGSLSDFVARMLFNLMRRWASVLPAAGPVALLSVIACWVFLIALGFALVFWASTSSRFVVQNQQATFGFGPMFYFSLEALTTLGLGDYLPNAMLVRILAVLEALIGFSIVTASISAIVLFYRGLGRMRSFARRLSALRRVEVMTGIRTEEWIDEKTLRELASETMRVRVDLSHFPIVYYFASRDRDSALSSTLPYLKELELRYENNIDKRLHAASTMLRLALSDLADLLRSRFVQAADGEDVFECYAEHHRTRQAEI